MTILVAMYVAVGLLLSGLSLPLIARKVPPNPLYGFRVKQTLEDPVVWYEVNAFAGRGLLIDGFIVVIASAVLAAVPSIGIDRYALSVTAIFFLSLGFTLVASFRHLHRVASSVDRDRRGGSLVLAMAILIGADQAGRAGEGEGAQRSADPVRFEQAIGPILSRHCIRCHGPGNRKGEISLASAADVQKSGVVEPGKPEESTLLDVVSASDAGGKPAMPKEGSPLSAEQVALLKRWIEQGAVWPNGLVLKETARAGADWWSLRPVSRAEPPAPEGLPEAWSGHPIDRFVFAGLKAKGLDPSPPADRRTLLRRLNYDLTGLPPTPEEIEAFVRDVRPDAYERQVDRLLASPRYGEHWGRHWLDVVRFGESRGYERNEIIPNAWPFRDYVIRSFNQDAPFDRIVREHLAGDVIARDQPDREIGTAFLVCGPYDDVGNQDEAQAALIRANTLDDIIRATSEAFLGITMGCARCHDHKFDPVSQRDYYGLYATFAGVRHGNRTIVGSRGSAAHAARIEPLRKREADAELALRRIEDAVLARAEARKAAHESRWTRPAAQFERIEEKFQGESASAIRLVVTATDGDPGNPIGYQIDEFEVWTEEAQPRNVALAAAGAVAAGKSRAVEDSGEAYAVSNVNDGKYQAAWIAQGPELVIRLPRSERVDRVVFSSNRNGIFHRPFPAEYGIEVSNDGIRWRLVASSADRQPVTAGHRRRRLLQAEMTSEEAKSQARAAAELAAARSALAAVPALPSWWAGNFESAPGPFHVFLGGDPKRRGAEARPCSPALLARLEPPYALPGDAPESGRRLALAEWLVDRRNPLTPRVLANRLWHYHFGTGIVDTPSDFGFMGGRPSHPELLDWLAREVIDRGWRLKPLHRLIVTSQTYRQSSAVRQAAARVDGNSRLLWRFPPRRLAAEEVRDTMLVLAGVLDTSMGGPGFKLYRYREDNVATYIPLDTPGPETYRRAVYHHSARASHLDLLSDFDCPDNAFGAPRRASTTSPLQALTMMNHVFALDMARRLAERLRREAGQDPGSQVRRAFELAFCRPPTPAEASEAASLVARHGLMALCRVILNTNELIYLE
jgi:hypothetical protein